MVSELLALIRAEGFRKAGGKITTVNIHSLKPRHVGLCALCNHTTRTQRTGKMGWREIAVIKLC